MSVAKKKREKQSRSMKSDEQREHEKRARRSRRDTERRMWLAYLRQHPSGDPHLRELAGALDAEWFKGGARPMTVIGRGSHNAHAHFKYGPEVDAEIAKLDLPEREARANAIRIVARRYAITPDALRKRMKVLPLRVEK